MKRVRRKKKSNQFIELLKALLSVAIGVLLALLIRKFIFMPTSVSQYSMASTLKNGDKLIINRLSMTLNQGIEKGDIVTFEAPDIKELTQKEINPNNPVAMYTYETTEMVDIIKHDILELNKELYIKRVIGVAGDHILIEEGKVYVNGEEQKEEYISEFVQTERTGEFYDIVVPEGTIFVMGDNRNVSIDSRAFGCVPLEKVIGKVWLRLLPFDKLGRVC